MYKHILIPTDGSELSQVATAHGLALAKTFNSKVTVLTVVLPYESAPLSDISTSKNPEAYNQRAEAAAAQCIGQAAELASASNVPLRTITTRSDYPWRAIVASALDLDCDLIVMASHGSKGVADLLLGSQTQRVLTHCKTPVLIHR